MSARGYIYFAKLPVLTIKVNSFNGLNKSTHFFIKPTGDITKIIHALQI